MNARDPKWIGLALKAYDACLPLYPREVREAHGEEMRQAFRERCREVARGQRGAWQWFGELAPDLLGSAARAQWEGAVGGQRRHHGLALAMLMLSLVLLGLQDTVSAGLLDWAFRTRYAYLSNQVAQTKTAEESRVRGLAERLSEDPSPESKAQAAFLYRTLYSSSLFYSAAAQDAMSAVMAARATDDSQGEVVFDRFFLGEALAADGDAAKAAIDAIGPPAKGWIAAAAFLSCLPSAGCDQALARSRLTSLEPDNAYGWSLEFKRAMHAHDEAGAHKALAGIAASSYYDDHFAEIQHEILGSSLTLRPEDAQIRAAVARRLADGAYYGTADFASDARLQCSRREAGQAPPTWAESHPDSEAGCLHLARLLTRSSGPFDVLRGWALLAQRDASPRTAEALDRARTSYRAQSTAIGSTPLDNHRYLPWSDAQWNDWAKATYSGD
jgi:hypothetical protein